MKKLVLILHNIRSIYNVGAILRTADGFGVAKVVFSGYTPYPDKGLPHEREKLRAAIHKTALGAEESVEWEYARDVLEVIDGYRLKGFEVLALEQGAGSRNLAEVGGLRRDTVLVLGEEVAGVPSEILEVCDGLVEIAMRGEKESFNVAVAAGVAIWELTQRG
ncbi:MAG: TrmH family RNA methyltransferase [Candidatus Nomurabacteria bacterium]|jgi:tRNA G18 (ribose-2'-O)-methylase SpoU|nr:TrmH family RNA methyltransferase [Candidatus Nomurabacteria bacterium]